MPNNAGGSKKPQRRFQFIDNSNAAASGQNSTQVRRHVMQEYMREKRWEARSRAHSSVYRRETRSEPGQEPQPLPPTESLRPLAVRQPQTNHDSIDILSQSGAHMPQQALSATLPVQQWQTPPSDMSDDGLWAVMPPAWHNQVSSSPTKLLALNADSFAALADLVPEPASPTQTFDSATSWSPPTTNTSPLSILSAARTDPFDVLPVAPTPKDRELFDFYAVVMPSCSYGFERKHHKAHNWYRDVFIPEAMKGPVTFKNTILVHAANTQAWVLGLDESPLALEYRVKAISALEQHYANDPDDTSDQIITATMSAAALEDFDPRPERKPYAWIHWAAAMHKIRLAGGPAVLEYKPSLRKLINWQDYIFSGYDGRGSTFYFTPEAAFDTRDESAKESFGRQEVATQCEEFLTFLKCTEHLASVTACQMQNPLVVRSQPLRYSVFAKNHPLYTLVASPNKDRYTKTGQLKQIISRLGSLMTINIAIWEYRYNIKNSEAFFEELENNIRYNELDKNISVEALMQILLSGSANPALQASERPWLVGRLLKTAKRLSRTSWERLNNFLLSCLTLEGYLGEQMQEWEAALRQEIMEAPLVSHILPLMQS